MGAPVRPSRHTLLIATFVRVLLEAGSSTAVATAYSRAPPSPDLDLSHSSLRKRVRKLSDSGQQSSPEQIHLALAGQGRVAISWVTWPQEDARLEGVEEDGSVTAFCESECLHLARYPLEPRTQFGVESGTYPWEASGSFTCYSDRQYKSGALQTVVLGADEPLLAGTRYFYRVGDPQLGWSEERSFLTSPPTAPSSVPYRLGLIGDLGQTRDSATTLEQLGKIDVTSVLDVGDLSYANAYQPRWDSYGRLVENHASQVAWMHIEGNHEEEVFGGETGFVAYERRFWFPWEESGSGSKLYYSYEAGPLHVIMLGCYTDYDRDSEQYAWLERDLATVDRSRTPWLLVGMHAPWYNSNRAHQGEVDDMREAMEPLLFRSQVDIVFAGHVHAYERSSAGVFDSKRRDCAPTYIVIGDGGNREGLSSSYMDRPEWSEFREASYGFGVFMVQNVTHALWQWHRNQDAASEVSSHR